MTRRAHRKGMKKIVPVVVLVAFSLFSVELAVKGGLEGWKSLVEPWSLQVALDLVIACFLVGSWIRADARKHGINALPFLVALPFLGSIAALAYVVRRNVSSPHGSEEGGGKEEDDGKKGGRPGAARGLRFAR